MILFGTAVNAGAIVLGGALGLILRGRVSESIEKHMLQAMGLGVLVLGISGAMDMRSPLVMLISLAIGALTGELLRIEERLEAFTEGIKVRLKINDEGFTAGFVSATLLFCVGAMAIVGSFESGLDGNHDTLVAKGLIDGVISVLMASTLGVGILFSSLSVFVYQGSLVLLSQTLAPLLGPTVIGDISSVGSVLILAIGLRMMGILDIKVGNLLPAVLVAAVLSSFGL